MPDLESLLLVRLWVARLGERDIMGWWATDGILGSDGAYVGPRVLPKTHPTGRARIAFAVARAACDQAHPDPESFHLFRMDPTTEDRFDQLLLDRLDQQEWWAKTMDDLEGIVPGADTGDALLSAELVTEGDLKLVEEVDLGPAKRSLPLGDQRLQGRTLQLLSAGFVRSSQGHLAVPYVRELGQ